MAERTHKPTTSVETVTVLENGDLHELCDATEVAIEDGGGFGWLKPPARKVLEDYWRGVMLIPERVLIIGRIDGVVAASCQIVRPPKNNEAQRFACQLTTFFVAPWARGHGLAPGMLEEAEAFSRSEGYKMITLDVRSTQESAIRRYEGAGFIRFGTNPKYAYVNGKDIPGYYYYKEVK
jgi:ribosomal protein S18 acetylase RimI-like enzyme